MGENSHIEWTEHTFNPWIGCTKVSPGCAHCYAEKATFVRAQRKRGRELWGEGRERWRTSEETWKNPRVWNARAQALGVRERVFCASLSDWLDDAVPIEWLADLLALIRTTPHLDWQLLTKRPQNWRWRMMHANGHLAMVGNLDAFETCPKMQTAFWIAEWAKGSPPANVWMGTTVEDQVRADERIPELLQIPAAVRFLSCEPLLAEVDLSIWLPNIETDQDTTAYHNFYHSDDSLHWVICGGESGHDARPMHADWARSLRDQCETAGVPFFFKQWGEYLPESVIDDAVEAGDGSEVGDLLLKPLVVSEGVAFHRVGKKVAGRGLDGCEWNALPNTAAGGGNS